MPSPDRILAQLAAAAEGSKPLAVAWHLVVVMVALAVLVGWRPRERTAGVFSSMACASVAVGSLVFGNVFNALALAALALALLAVSRSVAPIAPRFSPVGAASLVAGFVYPHFLSSPIEYVYAAPLGVVPCATLYAIAGAALLGFAPRGAHRILVGTAALFYGVFGVARLGVVIDVGLAGVALVVLADEALAFRVKRLRAGPRARGVHP